MMYDILIVGGGPAGLSAAVNAAARGKRCAVLSNDYRLNPLFRSEKIDNYLGMRGLSGEQMLRAMRTNIPGLYAAGDCTGLPLQVAKAVGEGLIAAQDAARSLR